MAELWGDDDYLYGAYLRNRQSFFGGFPGFWMVMLAVLLIMALALSPLLLCLWLIP